MYGDYDRTKIEGAVNLPKLADTEHVLTPAACYHVYIELEGQSLDAPRYITTRATCFRNEDEYTPLERQWNFSMREIVCLGTAAEVEDFLVRSTRVINHFAADIGLPVEHIAAGFTIDLDNEAVQVDELSAEILGGALVADPFRYNMATDQNVILLNAKSIQLQLMVDLLGSEGIEMTGAVSGELPVTMSADSITIDGGRLQSEPPGGVIRYRSDAGALDAAVSDDGLAAGL